MSADNGIIIRKNDNGNFVAQMFFESVDEYPAIESAAEHQIFETLEDAIQYANQFQTEYGLTVAIKETETALDEKPSWDEEVYSRFGIASDAKYPVNALLLYRKKTQKDLRDLFVHVGSYMIANIEEGRERDLALTKLEEALMWSGKAIFK